MAVTFMFRYIGKGSRVRIKKKYVRDSVYTGLLVNDFGEFDENTVFIVAERDRECVRLLGFEMQSFFVGFEQWINVDYFELAPLYLFFVAPRIGGYHLPDWMDEELLKRMMAKKPKNYAIRAVDVSIECDYGGPLLPKSGGLATFDQILSQNIGSGAQIVVALPRNDAHIRLNLCIGKDCGSGWEDLRKANGLVWLKDKWVRIN